MSLTSGARLGAYEITGPLGAGGMGEVYRARDARLGRDVAIKVLPELFLVDPDRLARFEREAKTLAALNHPHIAQIYGLEEMAPARPGSTMPSGRALVMELVEGPTLDELIASPTRLALTDAIDIARQIADALECAHERGIVHRDLKPANVKVRDDGTVKVLDFGLAKEADAGMPASGDLVNSPTFTSPAMTERGLILGTAAYMAPEQARGRPVDKRADIWAFGQVSTDKPVFVRWMPGSRHLVYFVDEGRHLVRVDTETGARGIVDVRLPLPSIQDEFGVAADGRAIYYGGQRAEADIWMVQKLIVDGR